MAKQLEKKKRGEDGARVSPRRLAVVCLTRWSREKTAIGPVMDSVIYRSGAGLKDKQLAVMLVNGVLRRKQYLDSIIEQFSSHPLRKMKSLIKMTLRTGIFQVVFLDRIPESAAVNETINVLRAERQPRWMVNFANGVLRSVVRKKASLPDTATVLNHPQWLVDRWLQRYGRAKTSEICRQNNSEPALTLRVNTDRIDPAGLAERFQQAGIEVRPGGYLPEALVLESYSGPVAALPGYGGGLFHVQDEGAQLVTCLCGPFEGDRYLDSCAGLGGKTMQLAQLLSGEAQLVAIEPNDRRALLLSENLKRLGMKRVTVFHGTLESFAAAAPGLFGSVLVDAPCSGTGVTGRHPDIRWNRRQEDLHTYQAVQLALLKEASGLVAPAGVLVYATCSMEPEENSMVVDAFLQQENNFILTDCRCMVPDKAVSLVNSTGCISTTPADGLDGFFGARLVRKV